MKGKRKMSLGEKIIELRKEKKLSQEELAEKIGVTRQTISNWELNETAPNIVEATKLAEIFNTSLDELVGNNIKSILEDKISNTEKLAGVILKLLKGAGILFIVVIVIMILIIGIGFSHFTKQQKSITESNAKCTLNGEEYTYKIEYDKNNTIRMAGGSTFIADNVGAENYKKAEQLLKAIEEYFKENGGTCTLN